MHLGFKGVFLAPEQQGHTDVCCHVMSCDIYFFFFFQIETLEKVGSSNKREKTKLTNKTRCVIVTSETAAEADAKRFLQTPADHMSSPVTSQLFPIMK